MCTVYTLFLTFSFWVWLCTRPFASFLDRNSKERAEPENWAKGHLLVSVRANGHGVIINKSVKRHNQNTFWLVWVTFVCGG